MTSSSKLIFFWDYDTQWGADRSRSPGGPKSWGHLEFVNTERLLELHASYNIPACFAVVGAAALPGERPYHDPKQIRSIHEAGQEVGSHSFRHDWLPGLSRKMLKETLANSKDALEQCIGAPVVSFVPPWNQPVDYVAGWSVSLSERRAVKEERTDVNQLCEVLAECGYLYSRLSYRPLSQRLKERLLGKRLDHPVEPKQINGITSIRLNTPGGFGKEATTVVEQCANKGGWAVVYGHPHSLSGSDSQSESYLVPFFETVNRLRAEGRLTIGLPRDLLGN